MDKRWQLVDPRPCEGALRVTGAGTARVNGIYCPHPTDSTCWTKIGGTHYADSIYLEGDIGYYIMTSGGTYVDDPLNVYYNADLGDTELGPWLQFQAFGPGGDLPVPTVERIADEYEVIRNLTPTGGGKFIRERDLSNGCIGYRRKLASDLVFTGDDYAFFLTYEKSRTRRCHEFTIRRQWKCAGQWKTLWTGTFSTGAGKWDRAHCTFTVKPEVLDKYSCIMRAMNKKVNILGVSPTEVTAVIWPSTIQVQVFDMSTYPSLPFPQPGDLGYLQVDTQTVTRPVMGLVCNTPASILLNIYWREYMETTCIDGTPVPPPGDGWVLDQDPPVTCAVDGVAAWVRPPTITWPWANDPLVVGPGAVGPAQEPSSPACNNWVQVGVFECPGQFEAGIYICTDDAVEFETLTTGRIMHDVANLFVDRSDCGLMGVVSDFFEWDPPGNAPGYSAGINYVTGGVNQLDHLFLLQKSDAIDPTATNAATKGDMTLKEFLTLISTAFRGFWDIDDGILRIEHWSYWTNPVGLDLSQFGERDKIERQSYAHLNGEIPQRERASWSEALGLDFVGADIVYTGPCVTTDDVAAVKAWDIPRVTTDLVYVNTDPDEINKDGFVMLATIFDGADYSVILDTGALSGNLNTNAPLSWANLQRDYWTWDRYQLDAEMNEADTVFDAALPNIEQKDVTVKVCCEIFNYDARNSVSTELGKRLGSITGPINALIHREELSERDGTVTLTLRYNY